MTDKPTVDRLSGEEIMALKFAAHRQLARWSNKRELSSNQQAHRTALASAARTLANHAFVHGCELHGAHDEEDTRA